MNDFSCCSSCSSTKAEKIFTLGSYAPYTPGYGHTFNGMNAVGVAGENMGLPVARPYAGPSLPIGSIPTPYRRGDGNPRPYYTLPAFNSFYGSGKPNGFNPVSAYPSASNPTGALNPVGESMPAHIGHPYRVGGEAIGGMVQPLGFMV